MDHFAGTARARSSFFYIHESLSSNNKEADTLVFNVKKNQIDAMDYRGTGLMQDLVTFRRSQSAVNSPGSTSQSKIKKDYINSCMFYIQIRINDNGNMLNVYVKRNRCNGLHTDSSDARFGHVSHVRI